MSAERRRRRGRNAQPGRHAKSKGHATAKSHATAKGGATPTSDARPGERASIAVAGTAAGLVAVSVIVFAGGHRRQAATEASNAAGEATAGPRGTASAPGRPAGPRAAAAAPPTPVATAQATPVATVRADAVTAATDGDADPGAIAFYREKDLRNEVVKHVDEVRWSGRYLRVYTDLKEGDTHSRVAIELCRWTSEYLTDRRGDRDPVVFVHARRNDNGNVVLVNKLSGKDRCKSVETR